MIYQTLFRGVFRQMLWNVFSLDNFSLRGKFREYFTRIIRILWTVTRSKLKWGHSHTDSTLFFIFFWIYLTWRQMCVLNLLSLVLFQVIDHYWTRHANAQIDIVTQSCGSSSLICLFSTWISWNHRQICAFWFWSALKSRRLRSIGLFVTTSFLHAVILFFRTRFCTLVILPHGVIQNRFVCFLYALRPIWGKISRFYISLYIDWNSSRCRHFSFLVIQIWGARNTVICSLFFHFVLLILRVNFRRFWSTLRPLILLGLHPIVSSWCDIQRIWICLWFSFICDCSWRTLRNACHRTLSLFECTITCLQILLFTLLESFWRSRADSAETLMFWRCCFCRFIRYRFLLLFRTQIILVHISSFFCLGLLLLFLFLEGTHGFMFATQFRMTIQLSISLASLGPFLHFLEFWSQRYRLWLSFR